MRTLKKPLADATKHFLLCINNTRDKKLLARLKNCEAFITKSAVDYENAGFKGQLFTLTKMSGAPAPDEELKVLYDLKMIPKTGPGRQLYDELISRAEDGICPLCVQRVVKTIDHYLPREVFPDLAILPLNLVPACSDCNKTKHTFLPKTAEEQIIHPYFDKLDGQKWLHANVDFVDGSPIIRFRVEPPPSWDKTLSARVTKHFEKLELGQLYAIHGTVEIPGIRFRLQNLLNNGGAQVVKAHLQEQWRSQANADPNSWKTATYHALFCSDRFCNGDFGS